MAGMRTALGFVILCVTAGLVVAGAFVWIAGAATVVRPTSYVEADWYHDTTSPQTVLDESRSIRFTVSLVMDQPWVGEDLQPYRLTLVAEPGSAVTEIRIFNMAVLLCARSCSSSEFLYVDLPILDHVAPDEWTTYDPAHLLVSSSRGTPTYVTYSLPIVVMYADGTHGPTGGWWSGAHLAPITLVPDYATMGKVLVGYGGALFAVAAAVHVVVGRSPRRAPPMHVGPADRQ